jgi:hypothetical protein
MKIIQIPFLPILGLVALLAVSCSKDKDLTKEIIGVYEGEYHEDQGGGTSVTFSPVTIEVEKDSKTEAEFSMKLLGGLVTMVFNVNMDEGGGFTISEFETPGGHTAYGTGSLESNGTLKFEFLFVEEPGWIGNFEGTKK